MKVFVATLGAILVAGCVFALTAYWYLRFIAWQSQKDGIRGRIVVELEHGKSALAMAENAVAGGDNLTLDYALKKARRDRATAVELMPRFLDTLDAKPFYLPLTSSEARDRQLITEAIAEYNRPVAIATPTPLPRPPPKFVVLRQAVSVAVKYGTANIAKGVTLPLISRGPVLAKVQYGSETVDVPISATNLR